MARALQPPLHLFDYLKFEDASPTRHEYVGGRIHAMTGGTMRHNRISLNVARMLSDRFDGTPCQVFINDMKLHVQAADSVYYPDVLVYCGSSVAAGEKMVHDALLVVEVVSESSAGIDRREKCVAYQRLPGLRAYWIVSQTERHVELHERDATGAWTAREFTASDSLPVVDSDPLPLERLYAGTDIA